MHIPKIKRNIFGISTERSTIKLPAIDSSTIYLGSFVSMISSGTDATPAGLEYGVRVCADDDLVLGIAVGFTRKDSLLPIFEDDKAAGTKTAGTGEIPAKYAFASTNDASNTTTEKGELVEILPIMPGDILEVALWGASTVSVARATTTAAGTTTSSAHINVGLAIDTTYTFALLESSAVVTSLANMDFITTNIDGHLPSNPNHVFVMPLRAMAGRITGA